MLQHGQQVLQSAPQRQQRSIHRVYAAERQASLLTAPQPPESAQRRRRKRVTTLHDEQYEQQLPHSSVPWDSQLLHHEHHQHQHQQYTVRFARNPATLLTSLIASSTTWKDLQAICQAHQNNFGPIHTAAALSKLAKLARKPNSQHTDHRQQQQQQQQQQGLNPAQFAALQSFVMRDLLPLLLSHAGSLGARGLSNSIWALSKLQVMPQRSELMILYQHLAAVVPELQPQHISSVMYAVAHWQQQQQRRQGQQWQADMQSTGTNSRSSSALLAAGGTVGTFQKQVMLQRQQQQWGPGVHSPSAAVGSAAAAMPQAFYIPQPLVNRLMAAAADTMHAFGPQALSNTLYAAAVLNTQPTHDWLDKFWQISSQAMAAAEQQHFSNMIWAAAVLRLRPPGYWCTAWLWYSSQGLETAAAQGLSNSIWGLAKLGWAAAAVTPMRPPLKPAGNGSSSSSSEIVEANSGEDQDPWLSRFCSSSVRQLDAFSDQALSNCCWAMGSIVRQLQQQQQQQQRTYSSSSTGMQATPQPLAFQQLLLSTGWHHQLLIHLQPRLLGFNPQQLSNTIWGLASCGIPLPKPWLDAFVRVSGPKLMQFKPQELSATLVALARSKHHPGQSWMSLFEMSLQRNMKSCSSQVMTNVFWSLVVLRHQPGGTWVHQLLLEVRRRLAAAAAAVRDDHQQSIIKNSSRGMEMSASKSSSSSSIIGGDDEQYAFTPQGWSVLMLSLIQLSAAASASSSSSSSSKQVEFDMRSLFGELTAHLVAAAAAGDVRHVLSGFSSQGLALLAGAAAKAEQQQQQVGQQLMHLIVHELAHRCQQQQQQRQQSSRHRPRLFPEPEQQQQQQSYSDAGVPDTRNVRSSVNLTDISMTLWAAARLEMQPSAALLLPLLNQALTAVQQLGTVALAEHQQQSSSSNATSSSSSSQANAAQTTLPLLSSSLFVDGCKLLSALMYAVGFMGFHPGSVWFSSWLTATKPLLKFCSCWTLAVLLWATLSLQEIPTVGWTKAWYYAWQQRRQQQFAKEGRFRRADALLQRRFQQQQQHYDADEGVVAVAVAAAAARQGLRLLQLAGAGLQRELMSQRQVQVMKRLCQQLIRQAIEVQREQDST